MAITGNDLLKKYRKITDDSEKITGTDLLKRHEELKRYKDIDSDSEKYFNEYSSDMKKFLDSADADKYRVWNELDLGTRTSTTRGWLDSRKDSLEAKAYKSLSDTVDSYLEISDFYSGFEDEDAFNSWNEGVKQQNEMRELDLAAERAAIDKLKKELETAKKIHDERRAEINKAIQNDPIANLAAAKGHKNEDLERMAQAEREAEAEISRREAYYTLAERLQRTDALAAVADVNSEFYDKAFKGLVSQGYEQSWENFDTYTSTIKALDDLTAAVIAMNEKRAGLDAASIYNDNISVQYGINNQDYLFRKRQDAKNIASIETFHQMTDDEFDLFAYYLQKDKENGTELAREYIGLIRESLNNKQGRDVADEQDNRLKQHLFRLYAGLENAIESPKNLFADEYVPTSVTKYASGYIREDLEDKGIPIWYNFKTGEWENEILGSSSAQIFSDFLQTTGNMLPSILVSAGLNAVAPGTGAVAGSVLMGTSAAGGAKAEMLRLGYSNKQATAYGLMVGAAEGSMEYFLGHIPGLSKGDGIFSTLASKYLSKVDNALARVAITLGGALDEALEEGLQEVIDPWLREIATGVDWEAANIDEVLYSSLLGALTSLGFSGVSTAINSAANAYKTKQDGKAILKGGKGSVDALRALALEMAGATDSRGSTGIDKIADRADSKKLSSLAKKAENNPSAKNVGKLSAKVGDVISKQSSDKRINTADRTTRLLAARLGVNLDASSSENNAPGEVSVRNDVDVSGKVSSSGQTVVVSTGEVVSINKKDPIASLEVLDGERIVYLNTDGGKVAASDVRYSSESEALLYESFMDLPPAFANAVIRNYNGSVPIDTYISGMREGMILYGRHNFKRVGEDISKDTFFALLPEADQDLALKLGRAYAMDDAKKADKNLRNAIKSAAEKAKNSEAESSPDTERKRAKKGRVSFESGVKIEKDQRKTVALANYLARAIGIDIVFYDATTTKNANGKDANGYYDEATDTIYLDVQSMENDAKTIAFTLSHELVHFIKKWSPKKYAAFAEFLIDQYTEHGVNAALLLKNKMTALNTSDADLAYEEMIADACETMLLDSNAAVKLMELRKSDLDLFEKIKLHIHKILSEIRNFYKSMGYGPSSDEAKALIGMKDVLEKIYSMFEDVAVDAAQNYQALGTEGYNEQLGSDGAEVKKQVKRIVGKNGKDYGVGVYLDSTLLTDLTEDERVEMVKEYVKELGGSVFTAYDKSGVAVDVHIARSNQKFKNKNGKRISVNKDLTSYLSKTIKQESIALIDELILTSTLNYKKASLYSHDWLDNYGKNEWEYWVTYIQDKENAIWEATLNIANTANDEKILYDIVPIKMVEQSVSSDTSTTIVVEQSVSSDTSTTANSILQKDPVVKHQKKKTSNREILASALESVAKDEKERTKLREYRENIAVVEAEQEKLAEIRAEIDSIQYKKSLSIGDEKLSVKEFQLRAWERAEEMGKRAENVKFTLVRSSNEYVAHIGGERILSADKTFRTQEETKRLNELRFEANEIKNKISVYDGKLLGLEATDVLKGVLEREKQRAYKKAEQEGNERLAAARERAIKEQREIVYRYQESRKKSVEGRRNTEYRHKIQRAVGELYRLLNKATKTKHVPESLREAVAETLAVVNMDTVDAEKRIAKKFAEMETAKSIKEKEKLVKEIEHISKMGGSIADKISKLKAAYDEIKKDPSLESSHYEVVSEKISAVIEKVGDTPLRSMSYDQLELVYDMYKTMLKTVRDANNTFKENRGKTISELNTASGQEVLAVKKIKDKRDIVSTALQKVGWQLLKPYVAFRTIGSKTLTSLYNNLRSGEDTYYNDVKDATAFLEEQKKKYGYKSWDLKKTYSFTSKNGSVFDLTLEQIMSLHAYWKRQQARDHITIGGFVLEDALITKKNKYGVPIKYEVTTKETFNISEETWGEIVGKLSDEQKAYVDEMQRYLSDVMGAKGNEVSLALYDVRLFKETFYLPIKSSNYYRAFDPQAAGETKLRNAGFSNETTPHASNPIVLHGFTDLWAEHVHEMSTYHSFVLPLEDFIRVYNYKGEGSYQLKALLESAYPGASKYISKLLQDINGGVRVETVGWAEKFMSLAKKSAVMGSLSVAIQQPSAIMRAMAYINPKYFIMPKNDDSKLAKQKHKIAWEELKKYAPVAGIKEMGRFDIGVSESAVKQIKGDTDKTALEKIDDAISRLPSYMDEITWVAIWNAVKKETAHKRSDLEVGSAQFFKAAGERFTEVISLSQVYDSIFSRSDMMRNRSFVAKSLTAFMAEPTTALNMLWDAAVQAKRSGNVGGLFRSSGAVVASIVFNSALKSIIMAMRDDDEDESYTEKYLEHFFGDVKDNLNILTYIPFVKDAVGVFQGYNADRMDMSLLTDLKRAIDAFDSEEKTAYEKWSGLITSLSGLFGIPAKNVERDIRAVVNTFFGDREDSTRAGILYAISKGWSGEEKSDAQQLYEALVNRDVEQVERVKGRFDSEEDALSAVRSYLREQYKEGKISREEVSKALVKYTGYDSDDAYWRLREWDFRIKYGPDAEYSKYDSFYSAVKTGKNIKAVIKEYVDHGVDAETLAAQITRYYKPLYRNMSNGERAAIKGYLLNAYALLGYDRAKKSRDIDRWLEN